MAIRCVVGLGNPGLRYEGTRHNIGFWVVDRLAQDAGLSWRRVGSALEAVGELAGFREILLKPQTYMNGSGRAVLGCLERHLLTPEELLVVVDDADLPVSRLRLRGAGSSGGHRGLESIEETIGSRAYARLRIGVGRAGEGEDLADYLLQTLEPSERLHYAAIAQRGAEAARMAVSDGLTAAMNRFNVPPDQEDDQKRESTDIGKSG
jgi:PTH1 family peptidyl-tRNA hydrolase